MIICVHKSQSNYLLYLVVVFQYLTQQTNVLSIIMNSVRSLQLCPFYLLYLEEELEVTRLDPDRPELLTKSGSLSCLFTKTYSRYTWLTDCSQSKIVGFRAGYSTQHALIRLLEKWRRCLDTSGMVGKILIDLSKAYDCLLHDLLIAKLAAY